MGKSTISMAIFNSDASCCILCCILIWPSSQDVCPRAASSSAAATANCLLKQPKPGHGLLMSSADILSYNWNVIYIYIYTCVYLTFWNLCIYKCVYIYIQYNMIYTIIYDIKQTVSPAYTFWVDIMSLHYHNTIVTSCHWHELMCGNRVSKVTIQSYSTSFNVF